MKTDATTLGLFGVIGYLLYQSQQASGSTYRPQPSAGGVHLPVATTKAPQQQQQKPPSSGGGASGGGSGAGSGSGSGGSTSKTGNSIDPNVQYGQGGIDASDYCNPDSPSYDPNNCDQENGGTDANGVAYGEGIDNNDYCDPNSPSYDPDLCDQEPGGDTYDPCDPSSMSYDPDYCAGTTVDNGTDNWTGDGGDGTDDNGLPLYYYEPEPNNNNPDWGDNPNGFSEDYDYAEVGGE